MKYQRWTQEEDDLIREQVLSGLPPRKLKISGRMHSTVIARYKFLGLQGRRQYSDEYLLSLVVKYKSHNKMANSRLDNEPSPGTVVRRFGTWQKATELAGVENSSGLRSGLPTTLYLVKFKDFYKIGLTQSSVRSRFASKGIHDYKILDTVEFEDLGEAREEERSLLKHLESYRIRSDLKEGFTECFKFSSIVESFEDLFNT